MARTAVSCCRITDRVGFEPTIPLRVYRFSRPAPSATRTPVLTAGKIRRDRERKSVSGLPEEDSPVNPLTTHRYRSPAYSFPATAERPRPLHQADEFLPVAFRIFASRLAGQGEHQVVIGAATILRVAQHHRERGHRG